MKPLFGDFQGKIDAIYKVVSKKLFKVSKLGNERASDFYCIVPTHRGGSLGCVSQNATTESFNNIRASVILLLIACAE